MEDGAKAFARGAFVEAITAWKEAAAISEKAKQPERQDSASARRAPIE